MSSKAVFVISGRNRQSTPNQANTEGQGLAILSLPLFRLFPDLGLAAMRRGRDKELRLWHLARLLDVQSGGHWVVTELQKTLDDLAFRGLSRQSVDRLLRIGDGVFWECYVNRKTGERCARLFGLLAVCENLDVERLSRRPVLVSVGQLKSLKSWRSIVYESFFGNRWGNPISRQTLSTLSGKSAGTQRNYERAAKIESRSNAVLTGKEAGKKPLEPGEFVAPLGSGFAVFRRLGNSYRGSSSTTTWGTIGKRAKQELAGRTHFDGNPGSPPRYRRLYLQSPQAACRRIQRNGGEIDNFFLDGAERDGRQYRYTYDGTRLWTEFVIADGVPYTV